MNDLDDKIREALRNEDAELFGDFGGEPSMYEMIAETFRGRHRWLTFFGVIWSVVFMAVFTFSGIRFFHATATRDMLLWSALCIVCCSAIAAMKVWYWLELNKNAVMREIKRVELQIARLASRIKD